jgi:ABC-type sugar transport system ATPase subunit
LKSPSRQTSGVELVGLEKRFGDVPALRSLDLTIASGELIVFLGPSGCGKTTALRLIAGLEDPTAGEIYIDGRMVNEVEPARRDIAMVFQNYALYPHMSVRDNLGFGLKMRKMPRAEADQKVEWAASILGLGPFLDRRPGQLSGGQRQRVALGRAMVREPRVFLFDEPLSNLDARLRLEMRSEIAELHQRLGRTMIFVTHDQTEAMTLGQRIVVLEDGTVQQVGTPLSVYREPANRFVAEFIGMPSINLVEGDLTAEGPSSVFQAEGLKVPVSGLAHTGPAALAIRPEAIGLVGPESSEIDFVSSIRRLEPLGNEIHFHFDGPSGSAWIARVEPESALRAGDRIGVRMDRSRLHFFGGPGMGRLVSRT